MLSNNILSKALQQLATVYRWKKNKEMIFLDFLGSILLRGSRIPYNSIYESGSKN